MRCMSISGDLGQFIVRASGLELGLQVGEDLGVERTSGRLRSPNGGKRLQDGRVFMTEDDFGKIGRGSGSRMDIESWGCAEGSTQ